MRLPKQVLIIPYRIVRDKIQYCIFKRRDLTVWQWVAGGVEDFDKNLLDAAKRELWEETQLKDVTIEELELITPIPVVNIVKEFQWGQDVFYAKEYAFAANTTNQSIQLSEEHDEYQWVNFEKAKEMLKYDSNKSALWELDVKLKRKINGR